MTATPATRDRRRLPGPGPPKKQGSFFGRLGDEHCIARPPHSRWQTRTARPSRQRTTLPMAETQYDYSIPSNHP